MPKQESFERKAIIFLVKFFLIYAVLQTLILAMPLTFLQESIASSQASLLGLESSGSQIFFNSHVFEIVANCTGLMSISVLAAIVFSLRKPALKKKATLFALGTIILFPLNFARVYLVLAAALYLNPGMAEALERVKG